MYVCMYGPTPGIDGTVGDVSLWVLVPHWLSSSKVDHHRKYSSLVFLDPFFSPFFSSYATRYGRG